MPPLALLNAPKVQRRLASGEASPRAEPPDHVHQTKEVKFVVTDKTEIKNGYAVAKFEDIKVGDFVSGSRLKKSETEYELVKIH